jgi:hypothetical protein
LAALPQSSLAVGPTEQLRFRPVRAESRNMQGATLEVSVFLFCFAFGFLMTGKRPILTASTRALLVIVVGLAASFALMGDSQLRGMVAGATAIANVLFLAFVAIDFWHYRAGLQR